MATVPTSWGYWARPGTYPQPVPFRPTTCARRVRGYFHRLVAAAPLTTVMPRASKSTVRGVTCSVPFFFFFFPTFLSKLSLGFVRPSVERSCLEIPRGSLPRNTPVGPGGESEQANPDPRIPYGLCGIHHRTAGTAAPCCCYLQFRSALARFNLIRFSHHHGGLSSKHRSVACSGMLRYRDLFPISSHVSVPTSDDALHKHLISGRRQRQTPMLQ